MSDNTRYDGLQGQIRSVYVQTSADPMFLNSLEGRIKDKAQSQYQNSRRPFYFRPVWVTVAVLLIAFLIVFFAVGPKKVYAELRKLLGYIPGVGVVDTSSAIRVLKEPVQVTRDGVSITVVSAVLTADQTYIKYDIFGVPRSAYPTDESVIGCVEPDYLLLPNGTKLERMNEYPAVPIEVNTATLVIRCIANTLPGTVTENWEFPLEFINAPTDLTVMPVKEVTPSASPVVAQSADPDVTISSTEQLASVAVTKVIDTADGYVLVVAFTPAQNAWVQQNGMVTISDAAGNNVPYSIPLDIQNSLQGAGAADLMSYKFNASGVAFPITLHYRGVTISVPEPGATTSLTFDVGANPQPGQEWQLDQTFELAGHTLTLVSVTADSRGGYSFKFKSDEYVNGVGVAIEGYSANGGGGGGGGGTTNGDFNVSLSYAQPPKGKLTLLLSNLSEVSDQMEWTTEWRPDSIRTDIPATPELSEGVCANGNTIASWEKFPDNINGMVLLFENLEGGDQWGLTVSSLDGSEKATIAADANWGALTDDGTKVVFSGLGGFQVYDFATGTITLLEGVDGYNPRWSVDGTRIAYVNGEAAGVYLYDTLTGINRQISEEAYAAVVGWTADGKKVIIVAMAAGGSAWKLETVDIASGEVEELFVIENASYKALNAVLSADGQWLAYRGRDNASVYLVRIDGSDNHLLLDAPAIGTSGLAWASNGWLAVSLAQYNTDEQQVILLDPLSCQGYLMDQLAGNVQGIWVK